jgi:hypothetical protein
MSDHARDAEVERALLVSRLRAWRTSLLALHKVLVDAELARYGAAFGAINGPHHALTLLSDDPWFQWLRPFLVLVVQIDERLADERPVTAGEVEAWRVETRALLQSPADTPVGRDYRRSLQELPAAVVLHGKLMALTKDEPSR